MTIVADTTSAAYVITLVDATSVATTDDTTVAYVITLVDATSVADVTTVVEA